MNRARKALLGICVAIGLLGVAGTAPAAAQPVFNLDIHQSPTHFSPGGTGQYWIDVRNVSATATSDPITVTVDLPAGLTRKSVDAKFAGLPRHPAWSCPGSPGDSTVTCTTSDSVARHSISRNLVLFVDVAPGASGDRFTRATVSGGGAAGSLSSFHLSRINPLPAEFGIVPESWRGDFFAPDRLTPVRQAGASPHLATFSFDVTSVEKGPAEPDQTLPVENLRRLQVDLPPGFAGYPAAVGECPAAEFVIGECPVSSQVGRLDVRVTPFLEDYYTEFTVGVFNLIAPRGVVADLGFAPAAVPIHIKASLDPANGYSVKSRVAEINEYLPVFESTVTIWGVPADPAHDSERCSAFTPGTFVMGGDTSSECPAGVAPKPFLTVPASCEADLEMRLSRYDSWENSGEFGPPLSHGLGQFTDCEDVPFKPTVTATPTTEAADSPAGLDVTIDLPQNEECELRDPLPPAGEPQYDCGIATSPLRDATATLPKGLTVNAASANGLGACTPAQIGLGTDDEVTCPVASGIASVEVTTPALPDPVEGLVYLATPNDNPFNSLLAGYIVLEDVSRGLLVKIPGEIQVDEDTGQITGIFNDNPQLPFSRFDLHFKGGAHSTLITPSTCGNYETSAQFSAWSGKVPAPETSTFEITQAPGGNCPTSKSGLPHDPDLDAGSVTPIAGQHSPFVVNLRREDGSQRFSTVTLSPPPGMTAKLAGTPYCPDSALRAAENRDGADEQSDPSCPPASKIGTVFAAAGSGPDPYWAPGHAYLAGPYKGAPLSMAIVTPAVAGPFDLGTVVIRTALHVDPRTAEITAISDEIPEMLEGIPLNIREASIRLDKPDFTLNPTSCEEKRIGGELLSTLGVAANLSERFQLGECRRLGFKPRLYLKLFGKKVGRSANPRLRAVLVPRPGDANISFASVKMPNSLFLDQGHIRTVCTRAQFATDTCPQGSIYGKAAATTPLLDEPLRGNVYLRSSDNPLPDLVADLRGQVRVETVGRTDSVKGALRNTFDVVPDAPVSKFVLLLQPGNKSLLVASRNLCRGAQRALIAMRAHNGRASLARQRINIPRCRQIRKAAKRRAIKRKRARNRGARRSASVSAARRTG